jgi:hypothetical protein
MVKFWGAVPNSSRRSVDMIAYHPSLLSKKTILLGKS